MINGNEKDFDCKIVEKVSEEDGISIIINNMESYESKWFGDMSNEEIEHVMEKNMNESVWIMRTLLPKMIENHETRRAAIITIAEHP